MVLSKKSLDFLVAGLGMMGSITPHIIEQAGGRITGILGIDDNEVDVFLTKNRLPNLQVTGNFTDYNGFVTSNVCDAVLIAVPNFMHADMGIKAAKAKKHILVEKPLATNPADASEFYHTALESGVAAEINSQYRHHELMGTLKQMIESGVVEEVEMGYIQGWQANPTGGIGWRPEIAIAGKGKLVGDLGAHLLQTTLTLFGGEFTNFRGATYNVYPKRWKPIGERVGSFAGAKIPGPNKRPELWEEMDMFDSTKYSGDDRAEAHFELKTREGKTVKGKYILSQVDSGDEIMGNENNFYIKLKFKDGKEVRWFQEDPNHLEVLANHKKTRIERSSAPSMAGRPGGHPHGYGDAILMELDKLMDVATSEDQTRIRAYTQENIYPAVQTTEMINKWLERPLESYNGQLDKWLTDVRALRLAA